MHPQYKIGYEFTSTEEICETLQIFIDCNMCKSEDDFVLFCTKYELEGKRKAFFLTTLSEDRARRYEKLAKKGVLNENDVPSVVIRKYFETKFRILYKTSDGSYSEGMEIRVTIKLNKILPFKHYIHNNILL